MALRIDLAGIALRIIVDALARSRAGPIEPGDGVRLALAILVRLRIAELWQVREFWRLLRSADTDDGAGMVGYVRFTMLHGTVGAWHHNAGRQPPDPVQMAELESRIDARAQQHHA